MLQDLVNGLEIRKFRADEEDVYAYVLSTLQKTDKQDILSWVGQLSPNELTALVTPYLTERTTEKLANQELSGELNR